MKGRIVVQGRVVKIDLTTKKGRRKYKRLLKKA